MIDFFKENKILLIGTVLTALFFLLALALAIFNVGDFTAPLILHFDSYRGADLLAGLAEFWLIFVASLVIIAGNILLSRFFWERERFLAYFLFLVNFFVSILLLVAVAVIVNTN